MSKLTKPEEITKNSYDSIAAKWSDNHWAKKFWGDNFDRFYELLPSHSRLLEIGCGGGRDAQELIDFGYDYLGTDISEGQLEQARKNNPGARFEQISVYDLNFPEPFDGFWCAAVLLHIPKERINEALQAIYSNMNPGAIGFIAVKEGEGEKIEHDPKEDGGDRFFSYWRNNEFNKILAKNRFEVLHEWYMPFSKRTKWLTYIVRTIAA